MAISVRASFTISASLLALAACGGGDDDGAVTPVVDAGLDAVIDAAPPSCGAGQMLCTGECFDVATDEEHCGNCTTACSGGKACISSNCACPANFIQNVSAGQLFAQSGFTAGIGFLPGGGVTNLLVIAVQDDTAVATDYTLDGSFNGPLVVAGYDVDLQGFTASTAYAATTGTLRFAKICKMSSGEVVGMQATLTNVRFSAVEGIMDPTPIPDGCSQPTTGMNFPSITFSVGDTAGGKGIDCGDMPE